MQLIYSGLKYPVLTSVTVPFVYQNNVICPMDLNEERLTEDSSLGLSNLSVVLELIQVQPD